MARGSLGCIHFQLLSARREQARITSLRLQLIRPDDFCVSILGLYPRSPTAAPETALMSGVSNPGVFPSGDPTSMTRSSRRLKPSQEVSEVSRHEWHAARLSPSRFCGCASQQTGSFEHQLSC